MAWLSRFRKKDQNTRTCWDYTFQWTELHQTAEELNPMKFTYDRLADECLERIIEISPPQINKSACHTGSNETKNSKIIKRDLYALLRDNASKDRKLWELWEQVNTIPEWVDWEQIGRGQEVFYRYGLAALNALNFESLLGGMGAGRVVETLARTGGFSTKVARRRMFETTQHILQATSSLDSIKPGGAGHASSVRVRFLHAAVRQRIVKLAQQKPEYYSIEKFGIPINDLDCLGTINTFSTTLIWLGLPRQGIWLRRQEVADYIALWRLVAYYLGAPTEPFEKPEKARAILESLLLTEIEPTKTSQVLAKNIILSLENTAPSYASRGFMEAMTRWLNGKELSDKLDIGNPGLVHWALVAGYCLFVMAFSYIPRIIPPLDRKRIEFRRNLYYRLIMSGKGGLSEESLFDFKYVPAYTKTTELGKGNAPSSKKRGIEALGYIGLIGGMIFLVTLTSAFILLFQGLYMKW